MIGHVVQAIGAPCPTLVLDGGALPDEGNALLTRLAGIRGELGRQGSADILKNAIVRRSTHPLFDLDYRFVQSLPGGDDAFDVRGSCGHSILAAVEAAARSGMIQPLVAGGRVRVNVLNNGDNVVCEVEETATGGTRFTAHFLCTPRVPVPRLLMTGEPMNDVRIGRLTVPVSMVSMGNPYIFVPATALGIEIETALYEAGDDVFALLAAVRRTVCQRLGWDPDGAFPKVAMLLPAEGGGVAARAVSVPSWHPTLALTGAICLGAAAMIENTIAWRLARESGHTGGPLPVHTPGGPLRVDAQLVPSASGQDELAWVSVAEKQVHYRGTADLSVPADTTEEYGCQSLPL